MRLPDKQRIFNAIEHIETGEIPFLEIDPEMELVNQILHRNFPLGMHCFELEVFLQYPMDAVQLSSGLVTNKAPMVDPDDLEILETKYLREEINLAKSHGKKVFFHIDGKIDNMISDFVEMDVDILNPIDLCAGNQDIYEIKKKYGDIITISGNIDIEGVLKYGTPEEVADNVNEHIEKLGAGGGYIVSSSHNLHHYVPVENFYAMRDTVHNNKMKPA